MTIYTLLEMYLPQAQRVIGTISVEFPNTRSLAIHALTTESSAGIHWSFEFESLVFDTVYWQPPGPVWR